MLRVVSHIVLSPTNFFQQLCILLFLHLLIVLQIGNLLVLVLHMSKNCIHICISVNDCNLFFFSINELVTMTQDIDSPTDTSIPSIRCKQLNLILFSRWHIKIALIPSDYKMVKQLFDPTRFFLFHLLMNTHTCSKHHREKLL